FLGYNRSKLKGVANFSFDKPDRDVTTYYFYVLDPAFGPGYIRICSYFPYTVEVRVNGHAWAKSWAHKAGEAYIELDDGFEYSPGIFRTRVFTQRVDSKLDVTYKRCRVKQYPKEGIARRVETVINRPADVGCLARVHHLGEIRAKGSEVNHRLLMMQRAGQGC